MYHFMPLIHKYFQWIRWPFIVCLVGFACSEDLTVRDIGVPNQMIEDEDMYMQPTMPNDSTMICTSDENCTRGQYCALSDDFLVDSLCETGCRTEPDSCAVGGSRKRCNAETRLCELTCSNDQECFASQRCENGLCVEGCRPDDINSCPSENGTLQYCNPESFVCEDAIVCCDLDSACSFTNTQACEEVGGEVMLGVQSCMPSPCRAQCTRDSLCPPREYCADYGRCAVGCRVEDASSCPVNFSCDADTRRCVPQSCTQDEACNEGYYCSDEGECLVGCKEGECLAGQICNAEHRCVAECRQDEECTQGYCDIRQGQCRDFCDEANLDSCQMGEICQNQRCRLTCLDDEADQVQGNQMGNDSIEHATLITWSDQTNDHRQDLQHSETTPYVLCPHPTDASQSDEDWYQINLMAGQRVHIQTQSTIADGPLQVFLYDANQQLLASSTSWQNQQHLFYPENVRQGVSQTGSYFILVKNDILLQRQTYRLSVSAGDQTQACFDDSYDPQNNTLDGAQRIGVGTLLQFSESYQANLCLGDQDYYCFTMNPTDGLDIVLDTDAHCDPLQARLAASNIFLLDDERFEGYHLAAMSGAGRWATQGGTRYQILLDQDNQSFTADEWCLRISQAADAMCENYQLHTVFSRRQLLCTDVREPNNSLAQATILDGDGPLGNAQGEITYLEVLQANDLEAVQLDESLYICPDDVDTFAVQTALGDVWRAWIVDDNNENQVMEELKVRFIDDQGSVIGSTAPINANRPNQVPQTANVVTAFSGFLGIQVFGVEQAEGAYRIYLQRESSAMPCSQDVNEPLGGDQNLDPLSQLSVEDEGRLSMNQGYLCNLEDQVDEDWYAFDVAQDQTRICINSRFRHTNGDINIELFEYNENNNTQNRCTTHADCRSDQPGSSCILDHCQVPIERAQSLDDGELIHFSAIEGQAGSYAVRVYSPEQAENTYGLDITLVSDTAQCLDDYHEGTQGNNRSQNATVLGSGRIQLCDTWLCRNERQQGDWYEITVPAFAARSIHVNFESVQGRLTLSAEDISTLGGEIVESPRSQSRNVHCVNVVSGERATTIRFQIAGDVFFDTNQRIDYVLQVVPTSSDSIDNGAQGACNLLNAGLFDTVNWPVIDLR